MKYITGIHALNLPCSLETTGDWHTYAIYWSNPTIKESAGSLFGNYGIEETNIIPADGYTVQHGHYYFANTIRACLDLLVAGDFTNAGGMVDDYICNDKYNDEVFSKVSEMSTLSHWSKINSFMLNEYGEVWATFMKQNV